ncbi:MAG: hypothetical protein H0W61_01120 [Bacteroidetes bacterium]|nr:hypothetical protein [Bacteroidota bacterium]
MKKITLGFSLLAAVVFFTGCNKKTNVAPEQDMEFESTKNVTFGNALITEIDIIASYAGENYNNSSPFFTRLSTNINDSIIVKRDTVTKKLTVTYTGSVTCRDNKKRNGTIVIDYSSSSVTYGSKFYRDPGYIAKVTLNNYWVDGWYVDDVVPFVITNNIPFGYNLASTSLNWTMDGYFSIKPQVAADSVNKIVWQGKLTKTLTNTQQVLSSKLTPINWVTYTVSGTPIAAAKLAYTGTVTGVTSRVISYKFVIDNSKPEQALVRDFSCSTEKIAGVVTTPSVSAIYSEWHPFISGVATFTSFGPGTVEPRVIDYGSGANPGPCDNAGTVTIKGITYNIDFKK